MFAFVTKMIANGVKMLEWLFSRVVIWPQYCHFYRSIRQMIILGIVINSLSGRIKNHETEEFYIFSRSCDLVKTSCSPLIHIHAPQDGGISLIQRFSAVLFRLLLFQHDIILTLSWH